MKALKRTSFWVAGLFSLLAAFFLNTTIFPSTAYAVGESYIWTGENNIRANLGDYARAASLDRREGEAYAGNYGGGITIKNYLRQDDPQQGRHETCDYEMIINVDDDNASRASIASIERDAVSGASGCPSGNMLKDRWGGAITIGQVPVGVPGHTPSGKPPIPDGCPGSANPDAPVPDVVCENIPEGCPGSPIAGPPKIDPTDCPYAGADDVAGTPNDPNRPQEEEETVQCSSESSLSWILCPLLEMAINASTFISDAIDGLLFVPPLTTTGGGTVMYEVWDNIRNLSNAIFVLILFYLIFTYVTRPGTGALAVKRGIPTVLAAIVIANLSWYPAALLVDASNVAGYGVANLMESVAVVPVGTITPATEEGGVQGMLASFFSSGVIQGMIGVTGLIVVLMTGVWGIVALAMFFGLIFLAGRQAAITTGVIGSSFLAVLYALPFAQSIAKKVVSILLGLLAAFPFIMGLLAGSRIAASTLAATETGDEMDQLLRQIVAILIVGLAVAIAPATVKLGTLTAKGGFRLLKGSMIGGAASGIGSAQRQWLGAKMADAEWGKNTGGVGGAAARAAATGARFVGGYGARRRFKKEQKEKAAQRIQAARVAETLEKSDRFARRAAGVGGDQGAMLTKARGVETLDKLQGEEVSAAKTLIESAGMSGGELRKLAVTGTGTAFNGSTISGELYQRAAQAKIIKEGRIPMINDILANAHTMSQDTRNSIIYQMGDSYATLKGKAHGLNDDSIKQKLQSGAPINATDLEDGLFKKAPELTKEVFSSQDKDSLVHLSNRLQDMEADALAGGTKYSTTERDQARNIVYLADDAYNDPTLAKNYSRESRAHMEAIKNITI